MKNTVIPEALRWLANRYNVELKETNTSPEYKAQQQNRRKPVFHQPVCARLFQPAVI